jgi:hypothetical protein
MKLSSSSSSSSSAVSSLFAASDQIDLNFICLKLECDDSCQGAQTMKSRITGTVELSKDCQQAYRLTQWT